MASQIDICNAALFKLNGKPITSLADQTKEAVILTRIYDIERKNLIRAHFWNFATIKVVLPQLVTAPAFEYDYAFQLPSDCLRVVRLYEPSSDWKIVGSQIHSNDTSVNLEYVSDVSNEGLFDSAFIEVFILKLSIELCYAITGSGALLPMLQQSFDRAMKAAKQYDAMEDFPRQFDDGTWIDNRI